MSVHGTWPQHKFSKMGWPQQSMMFTVSIPLSGHIFTLVTCNRIFISWYFDGHQIYFSKIMCWIMLTNGPIFVVMTKQILCCIVFMEISSLFRATKMWRLRYSAVILQLNNVNQILHKLKACDIWCHIHAGQVTTYLWGYSYNPQFTYLECSDYSDFLFISY